MATNGSTSGGGAKQRTRRTTKKKTTAKKKVVVPEDEGIVRPSSDGARHTLSAIGAAGVRGKDITVFLRQLIMLLEAGTPLLKSLKSLAERSQRSGTRALVTDIAEYVEEGNPLWQAFERHPKHFGTVFVNMIKASEASGTLTTVLERLVKYREQREFLIKRVRGALLYPVILVVACIAVVLLIAKVVIPQFQELFEKMDVEIPAYTQAFIGVSNFIGSWWWLFVLAIVVLIVVYKLWYVRSPLRRLTADRIKMHIPILGPIVRKNAIVEFTRTMSLLLRSGLSMTVTLDLVRNAIHNQALVHVVQQLRDAVEQGAGLEEPLRDAPYIVPPVVTDMLVTGEESGRLDQITDQIADAYEEEVQIAISTLGDALVPVLTVIIGVVVILLALTLFNPLVGMIEKLSSGAI